jgi:phage gp37-like protein
MWINLFDEDDIVGYPIPPVISHCKQAVTADLNLLVGSFFSGGTPAGHAGYWDDDEVGKIIAEKPAID